jgi:uncharacterized OsmC-like protein
MTSQELRAIQSPLKEKYRAHPDAALYKLKASSRISDDITCRVETKQGTIEAGLHPAAGGDGSSACSANMLLEALAACSGVTLRSVAAAMNFDLRDANIQVEGDLDFRGTLAVDKTVPVGFKAIRVAFHVVTPEARERQESLLKLTERYCVVYQTLAHAVDISSSMAAAL